ncbi:uncharacterized protein LOC143004022 [Genypterus blacodes]|uniref:uncharacterized protein LOC143004022 n=1 Tax=Genypterus blacodes TaxID=154954 RepID=UPI003F77789C
MLCPAAVSAAAMAGWFLAVLGLGLSLPAEDNSEPDFTLCSQCFYRQMPPRGAPAPPLLRPLCHTLPGGQALASLYKPTCDTAVYSAFHLGHGWTEREGEKGAELVEEDAIKVAVPALLRPDGGPSPFLSSMQHWDSVVTALVRSSIAPQCGTLEGDLFILTGAGGLGAPGDGGEECQAKLLWAAVCCAVPEGKGDFTVALIRDTEEGEKQVSVKELEEMLGVAELFTEGCGAVNGAAVEVMVGLHGADTGSKETDSDASHQEGNKREEEAGSEEESAAESQENPTAEAQAASLGAQPEEEHAETSETVASESSGEKPDGETRSEAVRSEAAESSDDYTAPTTSKTDANTTSTLVYILSSTMSLLKAPLHPLFSTFTRLPGQVGYVLQEHLGVLSALPGDTFSLFHLLTSDLLSGLGTTADMVLGVGGSCFSCAYYCTSCMVGALLDSCLTGVTGMGTLAGDTLGIFGDALDNTWWVTRIFGGRLWEQSEGYVGTVMSEMGGQVTAVGGGFGRLVWRGGSGMGSTVMKVGGFIRWVLEISISAVRDPNKLESD